MVCQFYPCTQAKHSATMPFILDFNESLRFHRWSVPSSSTIKKTFLVNNLLTVSGYIQNVGKHQFGTVLDTSSLNILCYVLSEISAELDQDFSFLHKVHHVLKCKHLPCTTRPPSPSRSQGSTRLLSPRRCRYVTIELHTWTLIYAVSYVLISYT